MRAAIHLASPAGEIPTLEQSAAHIRTRGKATVVDVLRRARSEGRVALQPRCGVGAHADMVDLLRRLEHDAHPDILSVTIDSHTRLRRFAEATRVLHSEPEQLNGYPLVSHGWERGRELEAAVAAPLEVRHGSPDARRLFAVSIASGVTSFEGGGISYNLPYAKDVGLATSLRAWRSVDEACGELARLGVIVDRELFGTLTAVLVPPSLSLAITLLEALAAAAAGVRCLSIAYPQGGNAVQDVAALRCIGRLAAVHLPADVEVFGVLHAFMGVFPRDRDRAEELLLFSALVARLGGAAKLVTKTYQEAHGIPSAEANADGIRTARLAQALPADVVGIDEEAVEAEMDRILREVAEIVEPVLDAGDLHDGILDGFASGRLDIPFSASRHARSEVVPRRERDGAIRYLIHGGLPFSAATIARNRRSLEHPGDSRALLKALISDISYFE